MADTGFSIGGFITDISKLGASVFLGSEIVKSQTAQAEMQASTQAQTMKILTVAVVMLLSVYLLKKIQ